MFQKYTKCTSASFRNLKQHFTKAKLSYLPMLRKSGSNPSSGIQPQSSEDLLPIYRKVIVHTARNTVHIVLIHFLFFHSYYTIMVLLAFNSFFIPVVLLHVFWCLLLFYCPLFRSAGSYVTTSAFINSSRFFITYFSECICSFSNFLRPSSC